METKLNIYQKVLLVQSLIPTLEKDSVNPYHKSKYVSLPKALSIILPILRAHGVLLTNAAVDINGKSYLRISLINADDGDMLTSDVPMIKIDDMQKVGIAFTYAARYGLLALLGLAPEVDDDGNGVSIENEPKVHTEVRLRSKVAVEQPVDIPQLFTLYEAVLDRVPTEYQAKIQAALDGEPADLNKIQQYLLKLKG